MFLYLHQKSKHTQKLRICVNEEKGKDLTCTRRPWIFPSYSNRVRHRLRGSSSCNDRECWRLEDNNNDLSHDIIEVIDDRKCNCLSHPSLTCNWSFSERKCLVSCFIIQRQHIAHLTFDPTYELSCRKMNLISLA